MVKKKRHSKGAEEEIESSSKTMVLGTHMGGGRIKEEKWTQC